MPLERDDEAAIGGAGQRLCVRLSAGELLAVEVDHRADPRLSDAHRCSLCVALQPSLENMTAIGYGDQALACRIDP